MTYQGGCHCGQIAFEVEGNLEKVMERNCAICSERGLLHGFFPRASFRLLTPGNALTTYTFNKHTIKHRFCSRCGCAPFGEGVAPSGNYMVAVNARCLDGIDLSPLKVGHVDGRRLGAPGVVSSSTEIKRQVSSSPSGSSISHAQ